MRPFSSVSRTFSPVTALILAFILTSYTAAWGGTFTSTGSLTTPRGFIPNFPLLANGKVLFVGKVGVSGGIGSVSAELYDPTTGLFAPTGDMATARATPSVTLLSDGKVLVAGGQGAAAAVLSSAEIYDPTTGTFSATGSMGIPRSLHTATLLADGRVLIASGGTPIGGGPNVTTTASAELYDPTTGLFTPTGSMVTARSGFTATRLDDGRVLIAGGATANAELYDPATGTFSATGSMSTTRVFVRVATLLTNGTVLIAGGGGGGTVQASAELYDPVSGTFSATGNMVTGREEYATTRLTDGSVLFTGGLGPGGIGALASAELYDPTTGTFSTTAPMGVARNGPSATLLPDGRVLVAGGDQPGQPDPYFISTTAELYDPFTGFTPPGNPTVNLPSVTVTFSDVTQAGITSLDRSSSGPVPPTGFQLGDPPTYFNLTTTAVYSGTIQICINYSGITFSGTVLSLQHYENGTWVDATTSLDTVNQVICGVVSSLSPFAIFESSYHFSGFFPPVDNLPTLNVAKGGSAIPVKFSLGGNQGLNIFASGYPASGVAVCGSTDPVDDIEEIVSAGNSGLTYDPATDQYKYVWKTNKAWAGQCRQLKVKLNDGTTHLANFKFK